MPGLVALAAAALSGKGGEAAFHADAAGLAAAVAVAGFGSGGIGRRLARILLAAAWLALVHWGLGRGPEVPSGGTGRLALLALGVMVGAWGLRLAGDRVHCPPAAAGAVAAGVLWTACGALWWADGLADAVPVSRRPAVREAILLVDPFTATAHDVDGFERLKSPEVYAETTIATVPLPPPSALSVAAVWAATGALAALVALSTRRRAKPTPGPLPAAAPEARRAPAPEAP